MRWTPACICISSVFTCVHVQAKTCLLTHCSCSTWQPWIRGHWSNPWNWTSWIWKNLRGIITTCLNSKLMPVLPFPALVSGPQQWTQEAGRGGVLMWSLQERRSPHIKAWLATCTSFLLEMPHFEVRAWCSSLARVSRERLGSVLWHTITGWQEDQSLAKMFNEDRWGLQGSRKVKCVVCCSDRPISHPWH